MGVIMYILCASLVSNIAQCKRARKSIEKDHWKWKYDVRKRDKMNNMKNHTMILPFYYKIERKE